MVSKLAAGLTDLGHRELWYFGIDAETAKLIVENKHPSVHVSKDGLCMYVKATGSYDLTVKSASGKSESKVGTRFTTDVDIKLRSRSVARQFRALVEVHPALKRVGPVSHPSILEPDLDEPVRVVLWSAADAPETDYLYRIYLLT
jgi:hypothetical protein